VTIGVEVRLLNGVLGVRVVLENGARGTKEALVVAPHEDLEQMSVPGPYANDDVLVGERTSLNGCCHRVRTACRKSLHAILLAAPAVRR
jgi:hypothetical protein